MIAATTYEPIDRGARDGRAVCLTRAFNAPRECVFWAYTDPTAVAEWWAPLGCTIRVDEMDVRPGGAWRFVQTEPDGTVWAFRGVYREVIVPERLVYAIESDQTPGRIVVEEVRLEDLGGQTKLTITTRYMSTSNPEGP